MGGRNESRKGATPCGREALAAGATVLIDSLFDDYRRIENWKPETILATRLGKYLPRQYSALYTPLLFKQFGVCVVTVSWKLIQPVPLPPASLAEKLAALAILAEAKDYLAQKSAEARNEDTTRALEDFLTRYVGDTPFDSAREGIHAADPDPTALPISQTIEYWFRPMRKARSFVSHPYACGKTGVGQAYKRWLTPFARRVLASGIAVLIDEIFDDFAQEELTEPEGFAFTALGEHLPMRAVYKYTPLFLKQFVVCILIVAWKLAYPERLALASVGEELAAWAILTAARRQFEMEQEWALEEGEEEEREISLQNAEDAFEGLIEVFFDDEDFLFLFNQKYDGIDASPVGRLIHMTSLAFEEWLMPFSDAPERIAHPYTYCPELLI